MNLQIKKILNKSTNTSLEVDHQEFARLLIQECVDVIDGMRFTDEGPTDVARYQRTLCGVAIKEYFGFQSKGPVSSRNIP